MLKCLAALNLISLYFAESIGGNIWNMKFYKPQFFLYFVHLSHKTDNK